VTAIASTERRVPTRLVGPDVARAVALIGVVFMNYRGYLVIRGDTASTEGLSGVLHPWVGPLSTRFAATFVVVAGVGVTLLMQRAIGDAGAVRAARIRLLRRGLALFVFGWWFDEMWNGTILPYYGALFMLAALLFTARLRTLATTAAVAVLAAAGIEWWRYDRDVAGRPVEWLDASRWRGGLVLDTFVNGTHPLLPWLAFFCAGMIVGRLLAEWWWRPIAVVGGLAAAGFAYVVSAAAEVRGNARATHLASTDPFDRGLLYSVAALGVALAAYASISWAAERWPAHAATRTLAAAGQLSLSLYVAHALVFELLVDRLRWVHPAGLDVAVAFAIAYWVIGLAVAAMWQRRFGRGPAERLYRWLGG
jgi:uncharacterized membrane protein YeiB